MIESPVELLSPFLILGGGGMIGRAWRERLTRLGANFDAPPRVEMDLTRAETLKPVATRHWRTVINCAGPPETGGGEGVGLLARQCAAGGATLLHYSSADVFDGSVDRPISVRHVRNAVDAAGRPPGGAALGEELIEISGAKWIIVRSTWVYAPWGRNVVRTIAGKLKERPVVRVSADERARPTSAEHLVKTSLALLRRGVVGIWHVTDGGECSRFELACEVAANLGAGGRVEAESPGVGGGSARVCVLDLSRTEALLGAMEDWRVMLSGVVRRLE